MFENLHKKAIEAGNNLLNLYKENPDKDTLDTWHKHNDIEWYLYGSNLDMVNEETYFSIKYLGIEYNIKKRTFGISNFPIGSHENYFWIDFVKWIDFVIEKINDNNIKHNKSLLINDINIREKNNEVIIVKEDFELKAKAKILDDLLLKNVSFNN